jgi:ABC-2 type transport system ATP-binding protein
VVWAAVRELVGQGVTLLLTTQYLEEADELADQIVFLDHGRKVAAGTPSELRAQIGEQRVDVVAGNQAAFDELVAALGAFELTVSSEKRTISIPAPQGAQDLASVSHVVATAGAAVDEVALRRPTLDDAFLALTGAPPHEGAGDDDNHRHDKNPNEHLEVLA